MLKTTDEMKEESQNDQSEVLLKYFIFLKLQDPQLDSLENTLEKLSKK